MHDPEWRTQIVRKQLYLAQCRSKEQEKTDREKFTRYYDVARRVNKEAEYEQST